jgi:hypothetical protein
MECVERVEARRSDGERTLQGGGSIACGKQANVDSGITSAGRNQTELIQSSVSEVGGAQKAPQHKTQHADSNRDSPPTWLGEAIALLHHRRDEAQAQLSAPCAKTDGKGDPAEGCFAHWCASVYTSPQTPSHAHARLGRRFETSFIRHLARRQSNAERIVYFEREKHAYVRR